MFRVSMQFTLAGARARRYKRASASLHAGEP